MDHAAVTSGGADAVVAASSSVSIEETRIDSNAGGGVLLTGSDFSIVNTFITRNGNSGGSFGGVQIASDPPHPASARFLFNTVAYNIATSNAGVQCNNTAPIAAADSIVIGNGPSAQVSGACFWTYSNISPAVFGDGNTAASASFKDVSHGDFHLADFSSCIDSADPMMMEGTDFDGDSRPSGLRADIGADEWHL
jgi:hypothetical protein